MLILSKLNILGDTKLDETFPIVQFCLHSFSKSKRFDCNSHGSGIIQKQPPEMFHEKRYSYKFHKIHRKTPVPESLF